MQMMDEESEVMFSIRNVFFAAQGGRHYIFSSNFSRGPLNLFQLGGSLDHFSIITVIALILCVLFIFI